MPSLLVDFGLEVEGLFLEEVDLGVDLVVDEVVVRFQLGRLYVHQVDLLHVLHLASRQTDEITV